MKPVIGVMPLWDERKDSIWMLPGYLDGIAKAGGLPIVFPLTDDEDSLSQLVEMCDGLLFTGGQDVCPEYYKEKKLTENVVCCKERDRQETVALKLALEKNKAILGICRCLQFINVYFGGTLYQDLPSQHTSDTVHQQSAPYDRPVHQVSVLPNTPLYDTLHEENLMVNSLHHQAVKNLAAPLKAMAVSEDSLIEGAYLPSYSFLWAVQWHPEFSFKQDRASHLIFEKFVAGALQI